MPLVKLPDGSERNYDSPVTVAEVAADIGAGLAKAALAAKVNNKLVDTSFTINNDVDLSIITSKDNEGLEVIRHSTAHLLAHAVKELYPDAQVTIGPVIEDGFYYDFSYPPGFTLEDLPKIEKRMEEIAAKNFEVSREEIGRSEAIKLFQKMGEDYKAQIIQDLPEDELLTIYKQGDFLDLCRGPHVPRTGLLKAFKLTKVAGAYWRGDSNNEMLQRIYGTAWPDKKQLKDYLHRMEEAEKRDHRKLAKKMHLFHMQEEAPGMVFWHPNGWTIRQVVINYIRRKISEYGYQEINTPILADQSLWQKSGHMDKYVSEMFLTESENRGYAIKPMSCPCHIQVYNQGLKSYRDLPLRFAEFGCCHRNEHSGTLHGLMRLRNFTQDDAHIFCTDEQIQQEVSAFINLALETYKDFGFEDVIIRLSTRPEMRIGSDEIWDKAEKALETALNSQDIPWEIAEGDGAFYGPKIDFSLKDCIGRVWQCGTVQLDFMMPERLGATYIDKDGNKQPPVMIHRAVFGSVERFLGILIEHYAGNLPLWLAPVQVVVLNITDDQADTAKNCAENLKKLGFRVRTDLRNEKIGFKIREHSLERVPYFVIIGAKEQASNTVSVRTQAGEDLGTMSLQKLIDKLKLEVEPFLGGSEYYNEKNPS